MLLNNIFLCSSAITILLGTLWPLFVEALTGRDISVGAPYFNLVFLPLIMPAIFISGIIININWKNNSFEFLFTKIGKAFVIFTFLFTAIVFLYRGPVIFYLGLALSIWLLISIINDFLDKINKKNSIRKIKLSKVFIIPLSTYGMYIAHLGLAVFILGVAVSDTKKKYFEGVLEKGQTTKVDEYTIKLQNVIEINKKNWIAERGKFLVKKDDEELIMNAERRIYLDTGMPSTEAAIYRSFFSHLYIVMGQQQPENSGKRIVRVYYNPLIVLIWLGAFFMAFGGIVSVLDRKRKK